MPLVRGYSPNTLRKDDVSLSNVFPEELFRYRECRRALESELFSSHGRICLFALNALDQIIQQYGFDHVCAVIATTIKSNDPEHYSQRIQKWADSIPSLPFSMEDQKSLCVYASNFALERVAHYLSLVANAIA